MQKSVVLRCDLITLFPCEQKQQVLAAMSRALSTIIGKPEGYCMAAIEPASMIMAGNQAVPAAFVDVKSIGGLNASVNGRLSAEICRSDFLHF